MKLEKLINIAEESRIKHESDCDDILEYIIDQTIFDRDNDEQINYIIQLSVTHQPSDGFVLVDEQGNNISVKSIWNHLKENGGIHLEHFDNYSI